MGTLNPNSRLEAQAFSASSSKVYKGKRHGERCGHCKKSATLKIGAGFFTLTCDQIKEEIEREAIRKGEEKGYSAARGEGKANRVQKAENSALDST
jgi:hypothetical protein